MQWKFLHVWQSLFLFLIIQIRDTFRIISRCIFCLEQKIFSSRRKSESGLVFIQLLTTHRNRPSKQQNSFFVGLNFPKPSSILFFARFAFNISLTREQIWMPASWYEWDRLTGKIFPFLSPQMTVILVTWVLGVKVNKWIKVKRYFSGRFNEISYAAWFCLFAFELNFMESFCWNAWSALQADNKLLRLLIQWHPH